MQKINCAVPSCSELECVLSFHEEFRNTTHNCDNDDEAEQFPSTQVYSLKMLIVGRSEEKKRLKLCKLPLRN